MFARNTSSASLSYLTAKSVIPNEYDGIIYSAIPRAPDADNLAGINLVAQYIEGLRLRTHGIQQITSAQLKSVRDTAAELDENDSTVDSLSETYPSLKNVMQAFIDLGYLQNSDGVSFIKNDKNSIKYFIRQYNGIIIETLLTNKTYNAYDYGINSVGTLLYDDFSKGFIAYGYDSSGIYVQNSLGTGAGSLGFHMIPWNTALQLIIKCAVFSVSNPS